MTGKNKKRIKQSIIAKSLESSDCDFLENLKAEEMQHIIACAIVEAEKIKVEKEEEQRKIALAEWRNTIGYREYKNKFKQFFNEIKVFIKILFLSKKHIEGDRASIILLKSCIVLFFWIMKWYSLLSAIFLLGGFPIQYFMGNMN